MHMRVCVCLHVQSYMLHVDDQSKEDRSIISGEMRDENAMSIEINLNFNRGFLFLESFFLKKNRFHLKNEIHL